MKFQLFLHDKVKLIAFISKTKARSTSVKKYYIPCIQSDITYCWLIVQMETNFVYINPLNTHKKQGK